MPKARICSIRAGTAVPGIAAARISSRPSARIRPIPLGHRRVEVLPPGEGLDRSGVVDEDRVVLVQRQAEFGHPDGRSDTGGVSHDRGKGCDLLGERRGAGGPLCLVRDLHAAEPAQDEQRYGDDHGCFRAHAPPVLGDGCAEIRQGSSQNRALSRERGDKRTPPATRTCDDAGYQRIDVARIAFCELAE